MKKKVLITGIAGGQGQLLARGLADRYDVCGVDVVPLRRTIPGVRFQRVDLRKRRFEDVVRTERPWTVVHLGFVRHYEQGEDVRHDINVRGTKQLLDHCVKYDVEQLVVISSASCYGAFPENPYYMDEDFPLSASRSYPEIRDQVEVDTISTAFMWRHPEIRTCVLRPVHVLGERSTSMLASYLQLPRLPTVMGFDPMMQMISEEDMTRGLCLAIERGLRGPFNVVGAGEVPLHTAIAEVGATAWPIPGPIVKGVAQRLFDWGVWRYPPGVLDYLRYPVSISGARFSDQTGFEPTVSLTEMFRAMRERR